MPLLPRTTSPDHFWYVCEVSVPRFNLGELGALFGGAKPTKATHGDGSGECSLDLDDVMRLLHAKRLASSRFDTNIM